MMKKIFLLSIIITFIFISNTYASKILYLSYKNVPKKVYENQKFEIVIKALVTNQSIDSLVSSFSKQKNIVLLNPKNKWEKMSEDTYENRYLFKVKNKHFSLPNINVKILKNGAVLDTTYLLAPKIRYSKIANGDKRFSKVIASNFILKAYKTKQYTNKEALTVVDIEAEDSNLEDFYIQEINEQGISKLKDDYKTQNLIYYFVTPVHQKKLILTYYNTKLKDFKELVIPLILQNELVSTQTDLNPNDSSFEKYKKIAVLVVSILFLLLFLWKKKKSFIFISMIFFIISIIYWLPNSVGIIKKGSYIYILPTKNSTVFFKLENDEKVEKSQKENGFIKVIGIDKKFIGWVKESSFGKN